MNIKSQSYAGALTLFSFIHSSFSEHITAVLHEWSKNDFLIISRFRYIFICIKTLPIKLKLTPGCCTPMLLWQWAIKTGFFIIVSVFIHSYSETTASPWPNWTTHCLLRLEKNITLTHEYAFYQFEILIKSINKDNRETCSWRLKITMLYCNNQQLEIKLPLAWDSKSVHPVL